MLRMKLEQRVQDYLNLLDAKKYRTVASPSWEGGEERTTSRTVPEDIAWQPLTFPHKYGREFTSFWFRTSLDIDENLAGKELFLHALPNADTLVFFNHSPAGALNIHHQRIRLPCKNQGERLSIHLESYSGHYFPGCHPVEGTSVILALGSVIRQYPNIFSSAEIQEKLPEIYSLYYDVRVLFESAQTMDKNSLRRAKILQGLFDALIPIHRMVPLSELQMQCRQASENLKYLLQCRNGDTAAQVNLIGHAHIDHAWLWPIAETHKKTARTFANMCLYAEEFPEFIFFQSQPCQLENLRSHYPVIFDKVKAAYGRGQWEPNGGMWVEADCNIPSGESLIRQFLYGRKTTRELLNYSSDTLWLPDVFGYSAALPQILKGCGIDHFVTSKINWNDTTRFPYDKFLWKGIDGTIVNTLYILDCEGGYNGSADPGGITQSWNNIQHKEIQESFIKPIGEGDGGGGTHRSDLEMVRRLENLEGMPKVGWKKVSEALKEAFDGSDELPVWNGELYLEIHRGTYTSQSRTKRFNRKIEAAIQRIEFLGSLAVLNGFPYPADEMNRIWKNLLTLQFHDIIPGSSIRKVYEEAEVMYQKDLDRLKILERDMASSLLTGKGISLCNSLGFERRTLVSLDAFLIDKIPEGIGLQKDCNIDNQIVFRLPVSVPALGAKSISEKDAVQKNRQNPPFILESDTLSTPWHSIRFQDGEIVSLIFKDSGFDYAQNGEGLNRFILAEDTPIFWDAWDIDVDYRCKERKGVVLQNRELISIGDYLLRIRFTYALGASSTLTQDMLFYSHSPRIDFETFVDWQERRTLLKVAFPFPIKTEEAVGEIQFGHLKRPTHENRPEDRARFEICAHKWMGLTDGRQSAAVLNDCKYGWDVQESQVRLTLLKAAEAPDEAADRGEQRFTYSLLTLCGALDIPSVQTEAMDLNQPVTIQSGGIKEFSLASVSDKGIIIDTVKPAEKGEGTVIRFYESEGAAKTAHLLLSENFTKAIEVNLLEDPQNVLDIREAKISLSFHAFEIKTILLAVM